MQTKVLVPAGFDVTFGFTGDFCAANFQKEQPKSYASAVEHTLKNEKSTRAALFSRNCPRINSKRIEKV